MIQYARGRIKVLDRPKLEHQVCECYSVVKKEYDRLLQYATVGATKARAPAKSARR
jgi:hypothetical protein